MPQHRITRYLALAVSLAIVPTVAGAQGFGVNEIGTCAASRGFAVTGSPCKDASTVFWNPAAITQSTGWNFLAGFAAIMIDGRFTEDTTFRTFDGDIDPAFVPHFFATYKPTGGKLAYGLGIYVPYGLTSEWTTDFPGRFQAQRASLQTIYFQPNVAYQINDKWSVGVGPVIGHSSVELIQHIDLSEQLLAPGVRFANIGIARHTDMGTATLEGSSLAFGAHLGVFGKPSADWSVGARFLLPLEFDYDDATADFQQTPTGLVLPPRNAICYPATRPGFCADSLDTVDIDADLLNGVFATRLVDQGVQTHITHPAQVQFGVGYSGYTNWLLSADYTWTGWRRFRELPINFDTVSLRRSLIEDYNNTSAIRIGVERSFTSGANFRLGFSGVASAAPDETVTPLLPEQDRMYASIGGSYPFMGKYAIEAAYLRVMSGGKRGRIDDRASRALTAAQVNTGVYDLSANVFSVSIKANY
ncbi:MAG: OmpP1/FadL family transporter [Gemmatimonadaceae bacterium]